MAESWCKAFGRYLRTLRQRRGLSLQEVCSLSQAFAENLEKGYLSRCENGHQGPAFSKIIPLSRIYDVPADVLLERLELDMELDRVGSPPTDGMTFAELTKSAEKASARGFKWDAYGYLRDAVFRATVDVPSSTFRDQDEQRACAHMSCGTGAMNLGRYRFALYEYEFIKSSGAMEKRLGAILLERLSQAYRHLNKADQALAHARMAVEEAEQSGEREYLGYVYSNRACQAYSDGDLSTAADFYQKSYRAFRDVGRMTEYARSLHNLSQVFFDLGRPRAARRSLVTAHRMMKPLNQYRTMALGRILMGEMDSRQQEHERAAEHWREAASIARRLNDKVLRFKAEFLLFKQAHECGDQQVARSIRRRLTRLSNWIPSSTPELHDFAKFSARDAPH
jgi:transcriptional regulator with XRE-family HTH domain